MTAWLSAPDPSTNHATAREKRQQGTGTWLLRNLAFQNWELGACSFLWLHGKAGSGKTILSSNAIDSLSELSRNGTKIIYYYFDFQTRDKQLLEGLLRSLIVQLFPHNDQTFDILKDLYKSHSLGRTTPSLRDLKSTIRELIARSSSVYLFIDALDECEDGENLLVTLKELRTWNQANLHTFVTSRREPYIESCLNIIATARVPLEESVVDEDILLYIQHKLQHEPKLSKWSEDLRKKIESTLLEGANGVFRWVECQLNAVSQCLKPGLVQKTLKSLPKTLDDTYTHMLEKIPEDYVEDVRRILSCLICSFHPLAIEEIADTVAIVADGETFFDLDNRLSEPRDVLSICSGLVITAKSTRQTWLGYQHLPIEELRLAHFSVKEYLVSERKALTKVSKFMLEERYSHETLATLCIRYLMWCHQNKVCEDPKFLWQYATTRSKEVPFAPYAASSWSRHLRAAQLDNSSPMVRRCLEMLTNSAMLRDVIRLHPPWFRLKELRIMEQCGYVKSIKGNNAIIPSVDPVPPLYYACLLGLDQLVLMLLGTGEDVNCYCPHGTCLAAAVTGNHYSIVQSLLEKGAEVNAVVLQVGEEDDGCYSRTAIHEAVLGALRSRREDIITMLLAKGADVNIGCVPPGKELLHLDINTPLQAAVQSSDKRLVQLMIGAGADPDGWAGGFNTALESAAGDAIRPDAMAIMILLLDAGADPNKTSDPTGIKTPLWMAVRAGHLPAVQLLLDRGADQDSIKARIVPYLLRYSFRWGTKFQATIEALLHLSPIVHIDLPLVAAAKFGFAQSIDYMLQHGAPPDSQEPDGTTPLQAAAFQPSDIEVLKLLLDAGANVNTTGGPFGSALQAAALSGKPNVVRILLEKGASVNHAEGEYGTALQISRKRLEDQMASCPGIWKYGDSIERYGPSGYYSGDSYPPDADEYSMRGPSRNGDYEAKINILHPSDADYQGVIDLLLSYGAMDV